MDIIEVLGRLILLTKRNISLTDIGDALGIGRASASGRAARRTEMSQEEIDKVQAHFGVILKEDNYEEPIQSRLKAMYNLSDKSIDLIMTLLESESKISVVKILLTGLQGDKDAADIIKMLLGNPSLAEAFTAEKGSAVKNIYKNAEEKTAKAVEKISGRLTNQ